MTPLELLKLTYIAHGWSLALLNKPLVNEVAQAWQYGPVFPDLYHALKNYRATPVVSVPKAGTEFFGDSELRKQDKDLIASVYNAYKNLNGIQLSSLTHQPGTPWETTYNLGRNRTIDNDLIKSHFNAIRTQRTPAA